MGRGKVEVKKIENKVSRQVTFSKRRKGLLKKAGELAVLCDAYVGVIVFSERGRLFDYSSPASLVDLIHRYEAFTNTQLLHQEAHAHHTDHHQQQQMAAEISKLRHEYQQLEASLKTYTGEDLSSLTSLDELSELERQLESAVGKIRARKDELLINLTDELQLKIKEHGRHGGAGVETEETTMAEPPLPQSPSFPYLLAVEERSSASTMLRLWPPTDEDADADADTDTGAGVETEETMMAEPPLPQSPSFAYHMAVEEKSAASTMLRLWPPTDEDADADGGSSNSSRRGLQLRSKESTGCLSEVLDVDMT